MRSTTVESSAEAQERFSEGLWRLVLQARKQAAAQGAAFARDQAVAAGYRPPTVPTPGYAPDSVRTVIRENWRGQTPWEAVADRLETHVVDASRQSVITMVDLIDGDEDNSIPDEDWADLDAEFDADRVPLKAVGETIGWARVLGPNDHHCAFCMMLASRGPVYKSAKAAGRMSAAAKWADAKGWTNSYHDHCRCQVVMVTAGRKWDGRKQVSALEKLYDEAAARVKEKYPGQSSGERYRDNLVLQELDAILREREKANRPVEIPAYAA